MNLLSVFFFFASAFASYQVETEVNRFLVGKGVLEENDGLVIVRSGPLLGKKWERVRVWSVNRLSRLPSDVIYHVENGQMTLVSEDPAIAFNRFFSRMVVPFKNEKEAVERALQFLAVTSFEERIYINGGVAPPVLRKLGVKVESIGRYQPKVLHREVEKNKGIQKVKVETTTVMIYSVDAATQKLKLNRIVFNKHGYVRAHEFTLF